MLLERAPVVGDWDYRTANTKEYTHGIHPYPAMMIPQVARRLLQTYARDGSVLFDPYCGTGTTLLEGMLANHTAIGTDLNPLARLIARTKTTPLNLESLDGFIDEFTGLVDDTKPHSSPNVPNVDYWFSKEVQRALTLVLGFIEGISSSDIAEFFRVAFSVAVRKVSWAKNPEFKLVRISRDLMEAHNPDVFAVLLGILRRNRSAFASLHGALGRSPVTPSIHDFNSVIGIPESVLPPRSVDIVVTSPPYGDSRTTVAYGQFSRLSSQWLGYPNANRVDQELMGGVTLTGGGSFGVPVLDDVLEEIADADSRRASEVRAFFKDYRDSIANVAEVVKPGGYTCYVVGNRTVKGVQVPTAESTAAFFEDSGFHHVATFQRNIPNKRMPSLNSPSNVPGITGKTMGTESIVVCRRHTL